MWWAEKEDAEPWLLSAVGTESKHQQQHSKDAG